MQLNGWKHTIHVFHLHIKNYKQTFLTPMEKLQWFKFSPTDWTFGKIQRCPDATQGRFLRLCCVYWNKECKLSYEDAEIEIDKEHLDILILKKVIKVELDFIVISFLDDQLITISETSEKRRKAVNERWKKSKQKPAKEIQNYTSVLQNDTDKIREDKEKKRLERETKFKDDCRPFLSRYGEKTLKQFFSYWTEPTQDGKKMKFELERTFDIGRRLVTWKNNEDKFSSNQKTNNKQDSLL